MRTNRHDLGTNRHSPARGFRRYAGQRVEGGSSPTPGWGCGPRGAFGERSRRRKLEHGRVGESVLRVDAIPKVTGEFAYSSDLFAAGMLWGHTVRSPHAHAEIGSIDISEAVTMPGVHAVLTHDDIPGKKLYGLEFADQPVLAIDRVRYFGEPVALVAAEHPEQARRAAEKIRVEYEPLEPVDRPRARARAGRPPPRAPHRGGRLLRRPAAERRPHDRHSPRRPRGRGRGHRRRLLRARHPGSGLPRPGVRARRARRRGRRRRLRRDPVAARRPRRRSRRASTFEPEQVRIHLAGVGGAFGGREDLSMQIHGALLALHTSRPVKIVYTREESFVGHVHRHPARIWMEHRANRDGKLVNVRVRALFDGGAYASSSTAVTSNAASFAHGPYAVANALIEATTVYTNNPPCGAMRGFGAVQVCFAHEAQMDKLAAELGSTRSSCACETRSRQGDTLPNGQRDHRLAPGRRGDPALRGARPVARARAASARGDASAGRRRERHARRGHQARASASPSASRTSATRTASTTTARPGCGSSRTRPAELAAEVHCAAAEVGQGVTNVILQVARTELEVERRHSRTAPTATVDSAGSASASRMTWMASGAVQTACRAAREELESRGGSLAPGDEVDVERIYRHPQTVAARPRDGPGAGRARARRLRLLRHEGRRRGGHGARPDARRLDRDGPGHRPRGQPAGGVRADRGRHRAGPRPRAHGGDPDPRRPDHERELHGLPDPDDARHASRRRRPRRGARAGRALRREGGGRAAHGRRDRRGGRGPSRRDGARADTRAGPPDHLAGLERSTA